MAYFISLPAVNYTPQEFSYADLQVSDPIAREYHTALTTLGFSPENQRKLDEISRKYQAVSPRTKGLQAIDKALVDALQYIKNDADRNMSNNVEQAQAIKSLCDELLSVRQLRSSSEPVTPGEFEAEIGKFSIFEDISSNDYAFKMIVLIRGVITANSQNLSFIFRQDFEQFATNEAAKQAPPPISSAPAAYGPSSYDATPSAPYLGPDTMYPALSAPVAAPSAPYLDGQQASRYSDLSAQLAGMAIESPRQPSYAELDAQMGGILDSGPIDPDEAIISAHTVKLELGKLQTAVSKELGSQEELNPGVLAVDEFCSNLQLIGADRLGITMKVIKTEMGKIPNLQQPTAQQLITPFVAALKASLKPVQQQKHAPGENLSRDVFFASGSRTAAGRSDQTKQAATRKLIAVIDAYLAERSGPKYQDRFGNVQEYANGAFGQFGALLSSRANKFSDEKKALQALKLVLSGKDFDAKEEALLKITLGKGNPQDILQKFLSNSADVVAIFGKKVEIAQQMVDLLLSPAAYKSYGASA